MKAIIPVAGSGTRLRPHTYLLPKPLLMVAGKPIIGHILDKLKKDLHPFPDEVVFIVSYMADKIEKYIKENYDHRQGGMSQFKSTYIEQKEPLGLGHAIWLTKDVVKNAPSVIIYGDTVFEADLASAVNTKVDACLGVKSVEDPRRFGVVELDKTGIAKRLVEKPDTPISNLAIVGVNFIKDTKLMFECIEENIKKGKTTKGEFQFTDAMQLMIDKGNSFNTFIIDEWLDCGTVESMLDTNQKLLNKLQYKVPTCGSSKIKPPVFIHPTAKIENSNIGSFVSIDKNVVIRNSTVSNSIIYEDVVIENRTISNAILSTKGESKGTSRPGGDLAV
ncbi:MAG: sugar phosphate nucleotidyltransferase [bacterium]|nr:sugar phosphate nucleotidyltransferase [bacterium]